MGNSIEELSLMKNDGKPAFQTEGAW